MSDDIVYLAVYDESWPELAAKEMKAIRDALPEVNFAIEHIGSTAVPGLSAKPIVDLLVAVDLLSDANSFIEPLVQLGYSHWQDNPKKDHFFFVKGLPLNGGTGRTHHIHIYQKNHCEIKRRLLFRDYLRAHPESLRTYADLKAALSLQFSNDREAYTGGKTEFVNSILKLAEEEPSPVHLKLVQTLWRLREEPIFHRYLANHVYFSSSDIGDIVVRLTPSAHRTKNEVLAEVSFMDSLARNDFPLATPVVSRNGFLVEEIEFNNKLFFATAFLKIEGLRATDEESLDPRFLFKWGAYLAQFHVNSIQYGKVAHLGCFRPEWNFDSVLMKAASFADATEGLARNRLQECIDWLSRLEKGDENYGLVHGDLHCGNFFIVKEQIVSFDYDDSCYHWFLYDLAASLSTVLKLAKDESDRERIILDFFEGYESIRPLSKRWKDRFEAFFQVRLSLVFNWMNAMIAEGRFSAATVASWKCVEPWYLENIKRKVVFDNGHSTISDDRFSISSTD